MHIYQKVIPYIEAVRQTHTRC
uniref:Uncharacterized protein n=1 Tax=Arundo donax TaxID=35708 RepID=A0A0A9AQU8_ARUDO